MWSQQGNPNCVPTIIVRMPKRVSQSGADAFGKRLVALLHDAKQPRRGAGAYLAKKYHVSTVTANAWLNGEYKPNTTTARRIAVDHGTTFDALYFGAARAAKNASDESMAIDGDLLRQAVIRAEQQIAEHGLTAVMSPEDRAEVVSLVYEGLREKMGIKQVERFVAGTLRALSRGLKVS